MFDVIFMTRGDWREARRHVTLRVVQELGAHPLRA